jgi:hypothetical protein
VKYSTSNYNREDVVNVCSVLVLSWISIGSSKILSSSLHICSSYKPSIVLCSYLSQLVYSLLSFLDAHFSLSASLDSLYSCEILIFLMMSLSNVDSKG